MSASPVPAASCQIWDGSALPLQRTPGLNVIYCMEKELEIPFRRGRIGMGRKCHHSYAGRGLIERTECAGEKVRDLREKGLFDFCAWISPDSYCLL